MSSNPAEEHVDLIDFHVRSPVLPRRSSISEISVGYITENLIDTELPIFEQKLQTQSSTISSQTRQNRVDVEDILIDIDSNEFERDSLDGEEVEPGDFLNLCEGVIIDNGNTESSSLPVDNFEALLVLKNLDELLNATLEESEDITNGNSNDLETYEESEEIDDDTEFIINECLGDLDNYLQAIDAYDTESNLSDESVDQSSSVDDANFQEHKEPQTEFNEELARIKLRQIEENYRKFVAAGIVNRGYIDTENNSNFTQDDHQRRSSSACAIITDLFNRKQALKANTVNGARRERPRIIRRKSLNESYIAPLPCTLSRTSGTDADATAPEVSRLSNDVSRERHAHASADCCTGTVIVEPLHKQSKAGSSSSSVTLNETAPSEACGTGRSPWLRSSMRRLQQLTLPHVDRDDVSTNQGNGGDSSRVEAPNDTRPVSAPSRLPSIETSNGNDRSSRSRSRNLVSLQPNGRARSSSASSHSRRRRSVSSSGTSIASSVDSTLSRMPPLEGSTGANNVDDPVANGNQRRYAFLLAGIVYGAGKLKALKVIEAGRAEEKAKRAAERAAKLAEEKRLSAERDFEQIVAIFKPPPKIESSPPSADVQNTELLLHTSGDIKLAEKVFIPECGSSYEAMYPNDKTGGTRSAFKSSDSDSVDDQYIGPLDLSVDDVGVDDPSLNEDSNIYLKKKEEFENLPVSSYEDRSCRIPPED